MIRDQVNQELIFANTADVVDVAHRLLASSRELPSSTTSPDYGLGGAATLVSCSSLGSRLEWPDDGDQHLLQCCLSPPECLFGVREFCDSSGYTCGAPSAWAACEP